MAFSYIHLIQQYRDPVWGLQALPWIKTPLIRAYRNNLKKATFEWVANGKPCDIESLKRSYPIVVYADLHESYSWWKPRLP